MSMTTVHPLAEWPVNEHVICRIGAITRMWRVEFGPGCFIASSHANVQPFWFVLIIFYYRKFRRCLRASTANTIGRHGADTTETIEATRWRQNAPWSMTLTVSAHLTIILFSPPHVLHVVKNKHLKLYIYTGWFRHNPLPNYKSYYIVMKPACEIRLFCQIN